MDNWYDKNFNIIFNQLKKAVSIQSVQKEAEKDMPFGKEVDEALNYFLDLSEEIGLKTKNLNNMIGYADWGEGEELLAILCHIDVVPEGTGWDSNPFELIKKEDRLIGRGVLDDKGPTVLILNAIKYLKENGVSPNKKIRVIFGTNEESGWEGIKYYMKHDEIPDAGFTPDAEFPVIFAEKGLFHFKIKYSIQDDNIIDIIGGNAPNMVPNEAYAIVKDNKDFKKENGIDITNYDKDKVKIKASGTSAHASTPESGENAISKLIIYLNKYYKDNFFEFYTNKIGMEYNGQSLDIDFEDTQSGQLTFNVGMITKNDIIVDIRYPISINKTIIENKIKKELKKSNLKYEQLNHKKPLHVDKNSSLVQQLMQVYKEETKEDITPIAIGGGTYARSMKNAVAFGPTFSDEEEVAHQANEYVKTESFKKAFNIYTKALKKLIK